MLSIKLLIARIIVLFIPETRFFEFKRKIYKWCGFDIGKNTQICSSAKLLCQGELIIGSNVWIGQEAIISVNRGSSVEIEDHAKIGMRVVIVTGFHEITPYGDSIEGEGTTSHIKICKGSAISTNSTILPGIIIHKMAHVAAGSVVSRDVPEYTRVAGVPAKVIKKLL